MAGQTILRRWLYVLSLAVVILTVYSFKLSAPFDEMDDRVLITGNSAITDIWFSHDIFTKPFFTNGLYYRPFVLFSYMLEYQFFNLNAFYYHLDNVILHFFNALLVFFLAGYFFKNHLKSFLTALLFAVHPINWEAVTLISGRPILLASFFLLSACVSYLHYVRNRGGIVYYVYSMIALFVGLLCKEEVVMLVCILFAFEWMHGRLNKKAILRLIPLGIVLVIYFLCRKLVSLQPIPWWGTYIDAIKAVTTFFWALICYAKTFIFPADIYYDRSVHYIAEFSDIRFGITILAIIALASLIYSNRFVMSRRVKFAILWIAFTLLPVSQIFPINTQFGKAAVANHFFYLPSVGIFVLCISGLSRLHDTLSSFNYLIVRISRLAFLIFLVFLMMVTIKQNMVAISPQGVFKQTLSFEPDNVRVRNGLALEYVFHRQWPLAEAEYREILKRDHRNVGIRISLGRVLIEKKEFSEARQILENIKHPGPFQDLLDINLYVLNSLDQ